MFILGFTKEVDSNTQFVMNDAPRDESLLLRNDSDKQVLSPMQTKALDDNMSANGKRRPSALGSESGKYNIGGSSDSNSFVGGVGKPALSGAVAKLDH